VLISFRSPPLYSTCYSRLFTLALNKRFFEGHSYPSTLPLAPLASLPFATTLPPPFEDLLTHLPPYTRWRHDNVLYRDLFASFFIMPGVLTVFPLLSASWRASERESEGCFFFSSPTFLSLFPLLRGVYPSVTTPVLQMVRPVFGEHYISKKTWRFARFSPPSLLLFLLPFSNGMLDLMNPLKGAPTKLPLPPLLFILLKSRVAFRVLFHSS